LGGKAPLIVFEDADAEVVAAAATLAATFNTGQDCTAATRVYVHESQKDNVQEALVEAMRGVKIGSQFEEGVQMGPLISAVQRDRVEGFIQRAKAGGAQILTGGGRGSTNGGYYFEPTVITGVKQSDEVIQSEIFGPVLTVSTFKDEGEAVTYGNDVAYGLAASVWTKDISRAMRVARDLEFGTVWVNDHIPLASETPHGGFKQSGFGKDLSAEAVSDYRITKHVMIRNS
jgi:betaine-aldehyde dehydrogenase